MRRFGLVIAALAVMVSAAPASADEVIFAGLDVWYTPTGGANITVSIPGGFFSW